MTMLFVLFLASLTCLVASMAYLRRAMREIERMRRELAGVAEQINRDNEKLELLLREVLLEEQLP